MAWKSNVLVVANVTAASDELVAALRARDAAGPVGFTLLVPATSAVGGRKAARERLVEGLARMRGAGLEVAGAVGDSDPIVAVHEHFDPTRFDEIVVSTLPTGASRWLQVDLPHRVERMTDVPVQHVVCEPPRKPGTRFEAPKKAEHMGLLTPLEALGFGGSKAEGQDAIRRS